jgi:2-polyprenyl-3-methyl-5-hydroxy-6-metoxy-1,4-benzoquinol methylase
MTSWVPRWQPLSGVALDAASGYLSPALARHLLTSRKTLVLRYLGDRLWPAVPYGARLEVTPIGDGPLSRGALVLVLSDGIPDLLRVETDDGAIIHLRADADPALHLRTERRHVLGIADRPARPVTSRAALWRRLRLDIQEALHHSCDRASDAAETVRAKYDAQAPFYDDSAVSTIRPELRAAIARYAQRGALLVVAGSGAGAECRDLSSTGYRVLGIDFSEEMIRRARDASPSGGAVDYQRADLRHAKLPASSCAVVLFTPDVYSFIPDRVDRVESLRQLSKALSHNGALFVSARVAHQFWPKAMLWLQWCASRADRARGWGSSHTRWIGQDGALRRSFIRIFSDRQLAREFADAGLHQVEYVAGWLVLQRRDHLSNPR